MRRWVFLVCVVYAVVFSYLSIKRHNAFYSSFDLANMDQAAWTTIFSNKPFSISGINEQVSRLQFHSDFILILLAPFFLIWNDVRMLLVLQSVVIGLGGVAVYLISKKTLKKEWLAAVICLVYLLNPGLEWTNMYDFHGVSMAMTFLLFAVYFAMVKKWRQYWIFVILAMLTKEQVPLLVSMVGVLVFFFSDKKNGLMSFLSGFMVFGLLVFMVIPAFTESGKHWAWAWFGRQKGDGSEISLWYFLRNKLFGKEAIEYYYLLLRPFGFLPLLGIVMMIVSAPDLLINLLSHQGQMKSIVMHYDSGVVVGLILSLILAFWLIDYVLKKKSKLLSKFVLISSVAWLLVWAVKSNYYYSPLPSTPSLWKWMYEVTDNEIEFEKVLRLIPTEASITASSEVRPHLTHRLTAFNLPNGLDSDYIAMSLTNRIVGDNKIKDFEESLIKKLDNEGIYELVFQKADYYLYKK